jgi:carbon storage regulator
MLFLSRKVGETIVIGGRVRVTVTKLRSQSVSLGIVAPAGTQVDRKEIWDKKQQREKDISRKGDPC